MRPLPKQYSDDNPREFVMMMMMMMEKNVLFVTEISY